MSSTVKATLRLRYASQREAEEASGALAPENEEHLTARVEGDVLVLEAPERRLASTLATIDDALACLGAAQGALDATTD